MKYIFMSLLVVCSNLLFGQPGDFDLNIEYTPTFSKLTNNYISPEFNFSQQCFVRGEWSLSHVLGVSIGLGYLNARDRWTLSSDGQSGINSVRIITNHDYITIPLGLTYKTGSWFIRPEIGVGMNFSHPGRLMRQVTITSTGTKEVIRWDDFNQRNYNDVTFPIFLSIGREIMIKEFALQFGIKSFYSLERVVLENFSNQHYIGMGMCTGVRI